MKTETKVQHAPTPFKLNVPPPTREPYYQSREDRALEAEHCIFSNECERGRHSSAETCWKIAKAEAH